MATAGSRVVTAAKSLLASLTAHVYTDADANGVQGVADRSLAGVIVSLLNANGTPTGKTALTDASGNVTFSDLKPANYQVAIAPPAGSTVSQKVNVQKPITLTAGGTANAVEGVYLPVRFTTHIYTDADANGVQDVGDKNLAGVTVSLLNADGTPTGKTARTDASGNATFNGLKPGSYEVFVASSVGSTISQKLNVQKPIVLASGVTANAVEGLYAPARFTTHVYTDSNANGVQDIGDKNLAGVAVSLLNADGTPTGKTALTDGHGDATFSGLKPGSYEVSIALPARGSATQQTSVLTPMILTSGKTANAVEGVYTPANMTAHVYTDANANGAQDGGDHGLAGVTVNLLRGDGSTTGVSAITDANGNVAFSGLRPGSYRVSVALPAGESATQQTNMLKPVTLASGGTVTATEGLYAPATITAHVYTDANANGAQDPGESNLQGVTVNLLKGDGIATGVSAVTDANGNVNFNGLKPGSYEVAIALPAGDTVTQQTNVLMPITLASGATATATAGVYAPAVITAHVYTDDNANSAEDAADTILPGVTVNLLDGDGTATGVSAVTDTNGNVSFSGLKPGSYQVAVVSPAGDTATQQTNVLTPITLGSGETVNATAGFSVPPPAAIMFSSVQAVQAVAGANADVGLVAVGSPVYAADANVLTVGVGKQFQTIASAIAAAQDGDVILVDSGTYTNDFAVVYSKISLIAVGGRVTMDATVPPPNFKGILTQETDLTVVGFDFTNSRIPDEYGHNGAGIRVDAGNLTLENDSFVGNQDGLLTNSGTESITIDHCLFNDNGGADGNGAGNIHNVYIGDIASVTVTNSVFENAQVGHEFKSRAEANTLINNVFISGVGIGTGSYDVDLPNGGKNLLKNNTIIKGPNAENANMVHFGGEGIPYSGSSLSLQDNLFQASNSSAVGLNNQTAISAIVTGNVLDGLDPSRFILGPATASNNSDASGTPLPNAVLVGVLPGSTMIISDADPHTVVLQGGQIQAVEGGGGLLTLNVEVGHIIAIGGSGGMVVTETPGLTGGNQYTTAASSLNTLNLIGLGMNSIDSEGTDTIIAGDGNETGVINGNATITGGAGNSQWSVNGTASIYTGIGSAFIALGSAGSLAITGTNDFFQLNTNGGTATWNTVNAGTPVAGSVSAGALSMQVYAGCANITTSSGAAGVVLHLDTGDAAVRSLGGDTIYAGAGYASIIVSGAAKIYAGTGRLEVYGRSDGVGADVYGNGGDYLISGDTGNITYHGGSKASIVEARLDNITMIGGAGQMTINGGSRDKVVGGAGGIIYHDFGGGANTVTTLAGSTNVLELSGGDVVNSYGSDSITHRDGNNTINIYGNSNLWIGDGNSQIYLAGIDTVTVAPPNRGNNWFTVAQGAAVSFTVGNANWIHDAGATISVSVNGPNASDPPRSVVAVSGGGAELYTDPTVGMSVTTEGSSPVAITADGPVSIWSKAADTIHLGSGASSVSVWGNGAEIWAGSGAATVNSGDWTSTDVTTVHGGSGSISVTGCAGLMKFIGGSGSSVVRGTYGSLDIVGGSGTTTVGWSDNYGGRTNFIAGSGSATVSMGAQGGTIQFGVGDTTVTGSDWAHATTFSFGAGQSGTDIISNFVVGWDKLQLGAGVSVVSHDLVGGSAHFVLSSGANVTFSGISDERGLFA